ncbi:MAG TPA: 2-C-methyl-D-erythritol 4-phosphate cytidylyltransferase [Phycisphaerae bacterium]|nr:2-C-methyl-D-erythritol 4-phosphate cytidylyltransferase [Phycisphaerae bacterium]
MAKVSVIVPGAGAGERFGGKENKIFAKIKGQPMFLRTLEAFSGRDDICQTLLVCSQSDLPEVKDRYGGHLGFMGVAVVEGGQTRTESVRNALAKVSDEADFVCVHDAARPCLAKPWVDAVFAEAAKTGAAILALPIHGTIKKVSDAAVIDETLPREQFNNIWEAQTPQVFAKSVLMRAYEAGKDATDDASLVEAIGHPVSIVPGDPRNIKVTTPQDLAFAAAVINTLPKPKEKRPFHPFQEAEW